MKILMSTIALLFSLQTFAQVDSIASQKRIFFPYRMDKKWQVSIGIVSTTMPQDITEEAHVRVPAIDFHVIRKLGQNLYADGRLNIQYLQNLISVGLRLPFKINERVSMALGNDIAYWFGTINIATLRTKGHGFQNYPNVSMGYRFHKQVLLTFKAEAIMNFGIKTYSAGTPVTSDYRLFSGSAWSIILEQPFAGSKSMTLGFRAIYSDYMWQTWTLFENYNRHIFFPEITVGLIL